MNYIFIPKKDFALIANHDIYVASLWFACWYSTFSFSESKWKKLEHRLNRPKFDKAKKILAKSRRI